MQPSLITRPSVVPGREHTLRIEYNAGGQPTRIAESGFQIADPSGFMQASLNPSAVPLERVTQLTYATVNGRSLLHSIDGPLPGAADTSTYQYDPAGRLLSIVHPMHVVERFERDAWGRIILHRGLDGVREAFEYGAEGRIQKFTHGETWMRLRYDAQGRIDAVLDSLGQQLTLTRDERGELVQLADAAGNTIHSDYSERGEIREMQLLSPDGSLSQRGHRQAALAGSS